MKKTLLITSFLLICTIAYADQIVLDEVAAQYHATMPLMVGLIKPDKTLKKVCEVLKHDLEFTHQFELATAHVKADDIKKHLQAWNKEGYTLAIFMQPADDNQGIEWRVYDTSDYTMIKGKKVHNTTSSTRDYAHHIADDIWPVLTGSAGFFSTKIVYGKQICHRGRNCKRYIYMRDATDDKGLSEHVLVSSPTINIVPRWNNDAAHPLIIFSQYRASNIALLSVDMQGNRKVVSNFDGVNMQVAYSPEGKQVVYCLSRSPRTEFKPHITSQLYYFSMDPTSQKEVFKRLTHNPGNNFAPCWGPGNSIFYASDATKNNLPNICLLDLDTNQADWITSGCYATCPNYSKTSNKLVYTKMVNRKMQVFVYDVETKTHEQLTFDDTNKDDCSWSICGNLVCYSAEEKGRSRLAMFNLLTRDSYYLTDSGEDCSYPSWSPYYL